MTRLYEEERLGVLLRLLRPAPVGWVRAAQELPAARRTFDEIVARAEADLAFRNALLADLETALAAEGYEPDRRILDEIRERLRQLSGKGLDDSDVVESRPVQDVSRTHLGSRQGSTACLEPSEGRRRPDRAPDPLARADDARVGAGRFDRGRASASASSTRASTRAIRSWATLESAVVISIGEDDEIVAEEDTEGDVSGHGTACAGIVRRLAPEASISSVRVLGSNFTGSGNVLLGGLRYAIEQGFDVINMSLSTTKKPFASVLHELADSAYFRRTVLVASAHNMPVESYPWRFSSVISVGSHEEPDPLAFFYNPNPPVEFFGRGVNVEVPWLGGRTLSVSGNSFATPHLSSICALILSKHPELTPFQLKSVLYLTANNVGGGT